MPPPPKGSKIFPNSHINQGPSVQTHEPTGAFLTQTNTVPFLNILKNFTVFPLLFLLLLILCLLLILLVKYFYLWFVHVITEFFFICMERLEHIRWSVPSASFLRPCCYMRRIQHWLESFGTADKHLKWLACFQSPYIQNIYILNATRQAGYQQFCSRETVLWPPSPVKLLQLKLGIHLDSSFATLSSRAAMVRFTSHPLTGDFNQYNSIQHRLSTWAL